MEIKCECYDDFYTQWFNLTEDAILNSFIRAELMGFLANKEKKGVYYIGIKEDDWACWNYKEFLHGMEKYYECEWFDDGRFPVIREIKVNKAGWTNRECDGWEYISENGNHYELRALEPFGIKGFSSDECGCFKLKANDEGEFTLIDKFIDWCCIGLDEPGVLQYMEKRIKEFEKKGERLIWNTEA